MMAKVSIIIPVYNAERYIETCLWSVDQQTYRDFEVILVDDGSRDNSKLICESFCQKDPKRYKYYWQENSGVSAARNLGISMSTGEWIMFVDADDMISEFTIKELLKSLDGGKSDIVIGGYTRDLCGFSVSDTTTQYSSGSLNKLLLNSPNYKRLYSELGILFDDIVLMAVWGKLYRKSIINKNKLKFNTDLKVCEDVVFNYEYFTYIKNAVFSHSVIYYYRITEGSASKKIDQSRIINLRNLVKTMLAFRETCNIDLSHDITVYCCKMIVIWFDKIKSDKGLREYFLQCMTEYEELLFECGTKDRLSKGFKQNILYRMEYISLRALIRQETKR